MSDYQTLDAAVSKMIKKYALKCEELTEQELAEIIKQQIISGDIIRYCVPDTVKSYGEEVKIVGGQRLIYHPYYEKLRLKAEIETKDAELRSAREFINDLAIGHDGRCSYQDLGCVKCEAREWLEKHAGEK